MVSPSASKVGARPLSAATVLVFVLASRPAVANDLVFEGNDGGDGLTVAGVFQPDGVEAHPSVANPIIEGNNLYAPDLVRNGEVWNLYFGGWKLSTDQNDRIYLGVSDDLMPEGPWSEVPIIETGTYVHVNDASVQKRGQNDWVMAYTAARFVGADYRDWIAISTSSDGASWSPGAPTAAGEIEIVGADFSDVARPALLWTGTGWKLWFDGKIAEGPIHSYMAESMENVPKSFTLVHSYDDVEGFPGFFEPDVELVGGRYVAVVQRHFKTLYQLESSDGVTFTEVAPMLDAADPTFGRASVSNPGLVYDEVEGFLRGLAFGMTDSPALVGHDIGFAHLQYRIRVLSCPDTWHPFTAGNGFDTAIQWTATFDSYCRIAVEDPLTGETLIDQEVTSVAGDKWRFVPSEGAGGGGGSQTGGRGPGGAGGTASSGGEGGAATAEPPTSAPEASSCDCRQAGARPGPSWPAAGFWLLLALLLSRRGALGVQAGRRHLARRVGTMRVGASAIL